MKQKQYEPAPTSPAPKKSELKDSSELKGAADLGADFLKIPVIKPKPRTVQMVCECGDPKCHIGPFHPVET